MDEPSVLDYLKSRLNPRAEQKIEIPGDSSEPPAPLEPAPPSLPAPWRSIFALALALAAQSLFEGHTLAYWMPAGLYLAAFCLAGWAYFSGEWNLEFAASPAPAEDPQTYHRNPLLLSLVLGVGAFIAFGGGEFNAINLALWFSAIGLYVFGLWLSPQDAPPPWARLRNFITRPQWNLRITHWGLLVLLVFGLAFFFRFYDLSGTPAEPFSDHAEKLLDVYDLTEGQWKVFFERNTGREFFQMYLTAFVASLFGTGLTFISLKIGTAMAGLFTLPYIYLLGKELANRRVALFALLLAGMAYWPNVISRVGLRFPLYALFAAPVLYYLIRGLRTQNRNDFLISGLFLGLGLHGYSPFRFMPFVVIAAFIVYYLHHRASSLRSQNLIQFFSLALASVLVFIPLFRYIFIQPDIVFFRSLTRLGTLEQDFPGNPLVIFFQNIFHAMLMMNVSDGEAWVHAIPYRPALDVVSAALFALGFSLLCLRYLRHRQWEDLFILLCIPLLMMPSILSLAFPNENPSLNRTGAAIVPVFFIIGLALDGLYGALRRFSAPYGRILSIFILAILFLWAGVQNYNLIFREYSDQFRQSTWNSSEIARVIRSFADAGNDPQNAWVVVYPHWVDTRNVGIAAGYTTRDFALWPEEVAASLYQPGAKLYIIKENDLEHLEFLRQAYPIYSASLHQSELDGKNFWIFFVPAQE